jgi:hypothetical protein
MEELLKKFIEENLENYIKWNEEYVQQCVKSAINNKVNQKVQQYLEWKIKWVESELNKYMEWQIIQRTDDIPTWAAATFERIIEQRVLKKMEDMGSWEIKRMFSTRWWPVEWSVLNYLESVVYKKLNKKLNEHLSEIVSTYIKKLWVLNIEDVENEINDLQNIAREEANAAYEAWQCKAAKDIRNMI